MSSESDMTQQIRSWWADFPMTYGEDHGSTVFDSDGQSLSLGSREFFEAADQRFLSWNTPLHTDGIPFSSIFNYAQYEGREVLEVGCGMGLMAMCWAERGANVTAVDLNPTSVAQTERRFEVMNLSGTILEEDARKLPFGDDSFDFAYSWGVLHHSPHLQDSLNELHRVIRPGGELGVMLYNRKSLLYWMTILWSEGVVNLENRFLDRLALASRYTDGARQRGNPHTWPVTAHEIRALLRGRFSKLEIQTLGTDLDYVMETISPQARKLLNRFGLMSNLADRYGWSLWITACK
jgi:2-polyprenyl-3-methyl-5-hydroxy-6-metoxy-1,4-benzoquinol methylase